MCPVPVGWRSQLGTGFPKSCWNGRSQTWDLWPSWGTGSSPGPAGLRTCSKLAFRPALPAGHCPGVTLIVAVLLQEAWHAPSTPGAAPVPGEDLEWSAAGADGDSSHQLRKMQVRCHRGESKWLSLLLQEQDLTAEGRRSERALEVQKCLGQLEQSCDSRGRREGDAGDASGTMFPRYHLPHKHRERQRRWEVMERVGKVPGREESTGRWEAVLEMEGKNPGCWK